MRNLYRCLIFTALAIYLLIGGSTGLCKVRGNLAIEHHHHSHSQLSQSVDSDSDHPQLCLDANATSDCEIPTIPCDDSHKEDGSELTALTPDSPKPIASPFVGLVPAVILTPQLATSPPTGSLQAQALSSSYRRGSPSTLSAQLCRYLV